MACSKTSQKHLRLIAPCCMCVLQHLLHSHKQEQTVNQKSKLRLWVKQLYFLQFCLLLRFSLLLANAIKQFRLARHLVLKKQFICHKPLADGYARHADLKSVLCELVQTWHKYAATKLFWQVCFSCFVGSLPIKAYFSMFLHIFAYFLPFSLINNATKWLWAAFIFY